MRRVVVAPQGFHLKKCVVLAYCLPFRPSEIIRCTADSYLSPNYASLRDSSLRIDNFLAANTIVLPSPTSPVTMEDTDNTTMLKPQYTNFCKIRLLEEFPLHMLLKDKTQKEIDKAVAFSIR